MSERKKELQSVTEENHEVVPFTNFELYLQELGLPHEGIIASDRERKDEHGIDPNYSGAFIPN